MARGIAPPFSLLKESAHISRGYSDGTYLVLMTKHAIKSFIY